MPILFRCENCNQKLSISSRKAGKTLKCPKCAQEFTVPIPEAKLEPEEPAPAEAKPLDPLPPTRELKAPSETADAGGEEKADAGGEEKAWATTRELPRKPREEPAETAPQQRSLAPSPQPAQRPPQPPWGPPSPKGDDEEEEFTFTREKGELEDMDLTPMVDVTFLLLIFFMITASFSSTKTIETPAPDPDKKGAQTLQNMEELEMTSIMVRIDAEDNIFVDDDPVDPLELENILGDKLRAEQKNEVIIKADPKCRHEAFVKVFDSATGAGMQKIRLASVQSEE